MANNKSFALKDTTINKIRIRKNLTIEEIANAMNKPRGTVGRWFSGVAVPRHNNAIILADILDMGYEYLLDAVKNDHERWKKHEKGCKAKLKGEPNNKKVEINNEVKEEKPNDICNLPKNVHIEIRFQTDKDVKYDEIYNDIYNYIKSNFNNSNIFRMTLNVDGWCFK